MQKQSLVSLNPSELLQEHAKWQHTYFTIQQIDCSYRSINHWDTNKLLLLNRRKSNAWRRFNWYEWGWIEVLKSLRKWGISLPNISKIKTQIHAQMWENEVFSLKRFEVCMLQMHLQNTPYYLVLTNDAQCDIIDDETLKNLHHIKQEMLVLPLLPLINNTIQIAKSNEAVPEIRLTKKQLQLLQYVIDNNYTHLILFYANRPTLTIYPTTFTDMQAGVTALIASTDFTKIYLFQLDGEIHVLLPNIR